MICKHPPRSAEQGFILGYLKGTRHMGYAAEGLFHPDQVVMIEESESSSVGGGGAVTRGSSHSASAGRVASDARRRGNDGSAAPSPSQGGGGGGGRQQLYLAKTSSAESWSKYKIQDPRLQFVEGDYLVSERVSRTTGEHFGYVVDSKYPANEMRPHPSKSKGYFHPEQVQIVDDSSPSNIRDSTVRSSPGEKHNDAPGAGGGSTGGGNCAPDKDALLSRELSSKRRKIGRESSNSDRQLNSASVEAKLSQSLSAKRDAGNEQDREISTRTCTSQKLSASKRPNDPGTISRPLKEEDTEIKLSRGLSAKRIKRSDSAASSTTGSESNNSGINAKILGSRFQPPQGEQPPSNAAKRKVETIKPDEARATVARKDSSRSIGSSNGTNAKVSAKSDMDEAKEKSTASASKGDEVQGKYRIDKSSNDENVGVPRTSNGKESAFHGNIGAAMPIEPIHQVLNEADTAASAAAASEGNNALDAHDLVALQSKSHASKESSSSEYVQVPSTMAMKSRFPPGCVVVHTSDDESTNAYTICSVYLRLSSDELVSGRSNFDVLFKVGTGTNAKILSEESLVYARDCPIFIKSNAVPHVKSQSGWVPATVKSSITLPDALEEDYVVTIANGGTAHVPRVLSVIVIPLCPKVLACRRRLSTRSQHQW